MPYPRRQRMRRLRPWHPSMLPLDAWHDPNHRTYSDNGTTLAVPGSTVQLCVDRSGNGRNLSQGTSGSRAAYSLGPTGRAILTFDGAGDQYADLSFPCTQGLFSAHLLRFTVAGYRNIFERTGLTVPTFWVDPTGAIELNTPNGVVSPAVNDGVWRTVMTHTNPTSAGVNRSRMWINGRLIGDVAYANVGTNQTFLMFNRGGGTTFSGAIAQQIFASFDPTPSVIHKLHEWLMRRIP